MKKLLLLLLIVFPVFVFAQNVGIGTTTPTAKLEVKNPGRSVLKISSNGFGDTSQLVLSNRSGAFGTDYLLTLPQELGLFLTSASDLVSNTNDSVFSILINGNVGIGSKDPKFRLVLNDPTTSNCFMSINNATSGFGTGNGLLIGMIGNNASFSNIENGTMEFGTNNTTRIQISSAGNTGFGMVPVEKVDVDGNIRSSGTVSGLNVTATQILTAGMGLVVTGNSSFSGLITAGGTITTSGEINRTSTGTANMVPIAYGNISSTGFVQAGSGNFTVSHTASSGLYQITITGETYQFQQYIAVATAIHGPGARIITTGSGSGNLHISIWDITGAAVDETFHFVVYKQ